MTEQFFHRKLGLCALTESFLIMAVGVEERVAHSLIVIAVENVLTR